MFVAFCIKDRGKKVCIEGKKEESCPKRQVFSLSKQDALCFRVLVHKVHAVLSAESGVSNPAKRHLWRKNQILIHRPYARDAYLGILLSEQ